MLVQVTAPLWGGDDLIIFFTGGLFLFLSFFPVYSRDFFQFLSFPFLLISVKSRIELCSELNEADEAEIVEPDSFIMVLFPKHCVCFLELILIHYPPLGVVAYANCGAWDCLDIRT